MNIFKRLFGNRRTDSQTSSRPPHPSVAQAPAPISASRSAKAPDPVAAEHGDSRTGPMITTTVGDLDGHSMTTDNVKRARKLARNHVRMYKFMAKQAAARGDMARFHEAESERREWEKRMATAEAELNRRSELNETN